VAQAPPVIRRECGCSQSPILPGKPRGDADSIFLARPDSQISIARFKNLFAKETRLPRLRSRRSLLRRSRLPFGSAVGPGSNKFVWVCLFDFDHWEIAAINDGFTVVFEQIFSECRRMIPWPLIFIRVGLCMSCQNWHRNRTSIPRQQTILI
jgi:hypothetical protein